MAKSPALGSRPDSETGCAHTTHMNSFMYNRWKDSHDSAVGFSRSGNNRIS